MEIKEICVQMSYDKSSFKLLTTVKNVQLQRSFVTLRN